MITLENGHVQNQGGMLVPNGSISFQLNTDASVLAPPFGIIPAEQILIFQFDASGNLIQPAKLYSNAELNPQNNNGLGTFYFVTFYDANGARINKNPMAWQFSQTANSIVDISQMAPFFTGSGNIIFYPVVPTFQVQTVTVATLPAAPVKGNLVFASDARGPQDGATWGSTAVGSGTGALLRYSGSVWLVIG